MILQISSGQGPEECELAVAKLFNALKEEFSDIEFLFGRDGCKKDGMKSVLFSTDYDLNALEGSVQWICKSPYRPNHRRKNWFVDISVIPEQPPLCTDGEIRFEAFHCGGKGGQNVNKVETGVRLTHIKSGITVTSTTQRSQFANKKEAMRKLNAILADKAESRNAVQRDSAWQEHTKIVRGNPVRIYIGEKFELKREKD